MQIPARITAVTERFQRTFVRGVGNDAEFTQTSLGWWITVDHHYSIFAGDSRPDFAEGDHIHLHLKKIVVLGAVR